MKIIGGHDYYDGAGLGVDETTLFLRREEVRLDAPFTLPASVSPARYSRPCLRFFYVLVGGEVIPGLREQRRDFSRRKPNGDLERVYPADNLHYDLESALAAIARYKKVVAEEKLISWRRDLTDIVTQHFKVTEKSDWTDWMIENRVITGYIYRKRSQDPKTGRYQVEHVLEANTDQLKELEVYRVLDPATAHMRISNFIGGVLPTGTKTIEIEDRYRLEMAGFHSETSFRMPKGTKKPRRSKA